jgi:PPOX class probable F420-dependent enzyme
VPKLERSRNYWITTTRPDGRPHAIPVWGVWHDGGVVFGSHSRSRKARNLARDPRVVVHLESGDDVVILEGVAERLDLDEEIAALFEPKYAWKPDVAGVAEEAWFRVRPRKAWAWYESDYTKTATLYEWD